MIEDIGLKYLKTVPGYITLQETYYYTSRFTGTQEKAYRYPIVRVWTTLKSGRTYEKFLGYAYSSGEAEGTCSALLKTAREKFKDFDVVVDGAYNLRYFFHAGCYPDQELVKKLRQGRRPLDLWVFLHNSRGKTGHDFNGSDVCRKCGNPINK